MSVLPQKRLTAEEFIAWAETQQGRYELVDGEIFAQAAERVAHAKAKGGVYVALRDAVRKRGLPCHVLPDGVAVRVDQRTVFEPDAQVYCGHEHEPSTVLVENPIIVVEVLSPSTGRNDASRKLEGYFRLASVQHYLIVDPDQPLIIHHARWQGADILTHFIREGAVMLEPPGLAFSLAEIYGAQN